MKKLLTLLIIGLTVNICFAQRDTLVFPPSLQLSFPEKSWVRYFNYTKAMFMPGTLTFQNINNEELQMEAQSGQVRDLSLSPEKIIAYLQKSTDEIKTKKSFTRNECSVIPFEYSKNEGDDKLKSEYQGYIVFKYNLAYFAFISLCAPEKLTAQLDSSLNDLLNSIDLLTPDIIDKREGLPINEKNFDSLLVKEQEAGLRSIKNQYGTSELDAATEQSFRDQITIELWKKVEYQYTHEKYFTFENNIKNGHEPFNDWLDYELEDKEFDELKFYRAFDGNIHGETSDGFDLAVDSFMRVESNFPKEAETQWIYFSKDSSATKTLYWALTTAFVKDSSTESIIVYCFEKRDGKWDQNHISFKEKYNFPFDDVNISNFYSIYTYPSEQKTKGTFIVVANKRTDAFYIGNSQVNKTNFIKTEDALAHDFDASYFLNLSDSIHCYMLDKHYNNYIESRQYYWEIVEDKKLFAEIKKHDVYDILVDEEQKKSKRINEDRVVSVAHDILIEPIPPIKRIYTTALLFGDINKNGVQDCYTFSASNGELKSYKVCEITDSGVIQLEANEVLSKAISETTLFKKIQKISLNPINDEKELQAHF
ncbi:MAG: hypothetical protein ACKVTZ_16520 [Bacteroidia bacterium]